MTEYVFTPLHALVFSRYVEYHYDDIVCHALDTPTQFFESFLFRYKEFKCIVIYEYSEHELPTTILSVRLKFIVSEFESKEYFLTTFLIWRKDSNMDLKYALNEIRNCINQRVKICLCDERILNIKIDRCEECFVFGVIKDDVCGICLENDYRWVKLLCDCKDGRIIHRHCFFKLGVHIDSEPPLRRKCPYCRKIINHWNVEEVIEDPDFV